MLHARTVNQDHFHMFYGGTATSRTVHGTLRRNRSAWYFPKKAVLKSRRNTKMKLYCDLYSVLPCVENLGAGFYIRLQEKTPKENDHKVDNTIIDFENDFSLLSSWMCQEREQYISVSQTIEQFCKETVVWKLEYRISTKGVLTRSVSRQKCFAFFA